MTLSLQGSEFNENEVRHIDALRGFLCFYVMCFHYFTTYIESTDKNRPLLNFLFKDGYVAVHVFFALSGLLIFHSYIRLNHLNKKPWILFYIKRILRIFPAWLVALLIYSVYAGNVGIGKFLYNLFFLFGFQPFKLEELIVFPSWSLYVEEIFYLLFPIYFFAIQRNWAYILGAILLIGYSYQSMHMPEIWRQNYQFYTPFNTIQYFLYGVAAYTLIPCLRRLDLGHGIGNFLIISILAATFFIGKKLLIEFYVLVSFIFVFAQPIPILRYFVKPFHHLGKYCFSFYLMHVFAITMANSIVQYIALNLSSGLLDTLRFIFSVILSLAFGYALYHGVEKPGILLGRKLFQEFQPVVRIHDLRANAPTSYKEPS